MKRKQVRIDAEKCLGCGACARTCHQGVIEMKDGKAVATQIHACDGLQRCLPMCPADAISFELVEVEEQVTPTGCPGNVVQVLDSRDTNSQETTAAEVPSELQQWPVQIKLVPTQTAYFENANLLIAADCTAFTYGNFHRDFIRNHIVLIGCPKLDEGEYSQKLAEIIKYNNIRSIQVVRMEVPCCGGLEFATKRALEISGKEIELNVTTISLKGEILSPKL